MQTLRCDMLILGAGPAGMAAALAAAACHKQVIMLDDNPSPGGQIWRAGRRRRYPNWPYDIAMPSPPHRLSVFLTARG